MYTTCIYISYILTSMFWFFFLFVNRTLAKWFQDDNTIRTSLQILCVNGVVFVKQTALAICFLRNVFNDSVTDFSLCSMLKMINWHHDATIGNRVRFYYFFREGDVVCKWLWWILFLHYVTTFYSTPFFIFKKNFGINVKHRKCITITFNDRIFFSKDMG